MVVGINGLQKEVSGTSVKGVKKHFIGGGVPYNDFKFTGENAQFLQDLKTLMNSGYVFKINADFFEKKKFRKVFLRTELGYSHFDYKGGYNYENGRAETAAYDLTINSLTAIASLTCNFLNASGYTIYLGLGIGVNVSFYPNNRITSTNPNSNGQIQVKNIWPEVVTVNAGFFWKKVNAELTYRLGGQPLNYALVHSSFNTLGRTISYQL